MLIKFWKHGRKYPINRDRFGHSARYRAFSYFDDGLTPDDVAKKIGISVRTAKRYFYDWRQLPRNYNNSVGVLITRRAEFHGPSPWVNG